MRRTEAEEARLGEIQPEAIANYLTRTGWRLRGRTKRGLEQWQQLDSRLFVPRYAEADDYALRVLDALETLQDVESRPWDAIAADVLDAALDVVRLRVNEAERRAVVTVAGASQLIDGLAGLIYGAALEFLGRVWPAAIAREHAAAYLTTAKVGVEEGSFVVKALLPPDQSDEGGRLTERTGVADRLHRDLTILRDEEGREEEAARIDKAVSGAVLRMLRIPEARRLDFSFYWSEAEAQVRPIPEHIVLHDDLVPWLEQLVLAPAEQPRVPVRAPPLAPEIFAEAEIAGIVTALRRPEITIRAIFLGRARSVRARLGEGDYAVAIRAHETQGQVRAVGRITISAGRTTLEEVSAFELVD